jgi:hypothetical protein
MKKKEKTGMLSRNNTCESFPALYIRDLNDCYDYTAYISVRNYVLAFLSLNVLIKEIEKLGLILMRLCSVIRNMNWYAV